MKKAKNKAWKMFSKFIRLRDCLKTTGSKDYGLCITCGNKKGFKEADAGHFISGRGNAVLFDERIVNFQCKRCNKWLHGNFEAYYSVMINRYGQEVVNQMIRLKHKVLKMTEYDYLSKYEEYKLKYNLLNK